MDNQRPFFIASVSGHGIEQEPMRELVYPVIAAKLTRYLNGNTVRANTLKHMREEGHDIVVFHKDDAQRNRNARPPKLPLHMCIESGYVQSIGVLLSAGADTTAKVFNDDDSENDAGKTVRDILEYDKEHSGEIGAMLRASDARHAAMDTIKSMGLDTVCTPKPN